MTQFEIINNNEEKLNRSSNFTDEKTSKIEKLKKSPSKDHVIIELEQEKLMLEQINKYLTENENISNEVFDSMSHELRTPSVTIKAYTDLLLKDKFGNLTQTQREKLERIKTNTDLLIGIIFKMLEKSKKRMLIRNNI